MSNKKLKIQKKVEKFVISPSVRLFLGVTVTEDTDIEDEIVLPDNKGKIHQKIKDFTLTTTIINKKTNELGIETNENATLEQKIPKNTVLIWGEDTGYIVPPYRMVKVEDAIQDLEAIKGL